MSLQFSWSELWEYHDALEDPALKAHLEDEVVGNGWLYRQSSKAQERVLEHAPKDFIERIASALKPEVAIKLGFNPFVRR